MNQASLEEVHQAEQAVQFSRHDGFGADLKKFSQTALQVLLGDEAIEVLIEAFKCLSDRQPLLDNPTSDLVDDVLLPVKIVLSCLLLKVFQAKHVQELLVGDESHIVLVHESIDLLFDGHRELEYIHHASVELRERYHAIFVKVELIESVPELHALETEGVSNLLADCGGFFLGQLGS